MTLPDTRNPVPATPLGVAGTGASPGPVGAPAVRTVVGADPGLAGTLQTDHLLASLTDLLPPGGTVTTHLVPDGPPHVSVALDLPGPPPDPLLAAVRETLGPPVIVGLVGDDTVVNDEGASPGARLAVGQTLMGSGGRAVLFGGVAGLTGELTVEALLARSAVNRVVDLSGAEVPPATVVRTRDLVRPLRVAGHLVLTVQPARGGVVVPFEDPSPTPCCAAHA